MADIQLYNSPQYRRGSGIQPEAYGALGNGGDDGAALIAARDALASAANKTLRLGVGTYGHNLVNGFAFGVTGGAIVGAGIDATILKQLDNTTVTGEAMRLTTATDMVFRDFTLHGMDGFGTLYVPQGQTVRRVMFERVKFTADAANGGTNFGSTNGVRWVCDNGMAEDIVFRDCVFEGVGRMGVEFQNHSGDALVRYRGITFINCRWIDVGGANAAGGFNAGMGISLSGPGEDVKVINPYFEQVTNYALIENVGCSRLLVRDMRAHPTGMGVAALIVASNSTRMYDMEVDGFSWTTKGGQAALTDVPAFAGIVEISNVTRGRFRRLNLNTVGDRCFYAQDTNSNQCEDIVVEKCYLQSDTATTVAFLRTQRAIVKNNVLKTTDPANAVLVAFFGDSFDNAIGLNSVVKEAGATLAMPLLTGNATYRVLAMGAPATLADVQLALDSLSTPSLEQIGQLRAYNTVAYAASWVPNGDQGNARMILTGNVTVGQALPRYPGQTFYYELTQDATGGRTIGWHSDYYGDLTAYSKAPNARNFFRVEVTNEFRYAVTALQAANNVPVVQLSANFPSGTVSWDSGIQDARAIAAVANAHTIQADSGDPSMLRQFQWLFKNTSGSSYVITFTGGVAKGFDNRLGLADLVVNGSNWDLTLPASQDAFVDLYYDSSVSRWVFQTATIG